MEIDIKKAKWFFVVKDVTGHTKKEIKDKIKNTILPLIKSGERKGIIKNGTWELILIGIDKLHFININKEINKISRRIQAGFIKGEIIQEKEVEEGQADRDIEGLVKVFCKNCSNKTITKEVLTKYSCPAEFLMPYSRGYEELCKGERGCFHYIPKKKTVKRIRKDIIITSLFEFGIQIKLQT